MSLCSPSSFSLASSHSLQSLMLHSAQSRVINLFLSHPFSFTQFRFGLLASFFTGFIFASLETFLFYLFFLHNGSYLIEFSWRFCWLFNSLRIIFYADVNRACLRFSNGLLILGCCRCNFLLHVF